MDPIANLSWGSHICQFFHTREDLLEILLPYFATGLAQHEKCLWVTCEPLRKDDAINELRRLVSDVDARLDRGQLEVIDVSDWYSSSSDFDGEATLRSWIQKYDEAIESGYRGLRLSGNTMWLDASGWDDFVAYERAVNQAFKPLRVIALCTYSLDRCGAREILDVVRNHEYAVARRSGEWEVIESSSLNMAKAELTRLNEELESLVAEQTGFLRESQQRLALALEGGEMGAWEWSAELGVLFVDVAAANLLDLDSSQSEIDEGDLLARIHEEDQPALQAAISDAFANDTPVQIEFRVVRRDRPARWLSFRGKMTDGSEGSPGRLFGVVFDVTRRRRDQERQQLLLAELSHRVKNTLATVQATASQTLRHASTIEDFRRSFEGRIASLARSHTLLTRSQWDGASLRDLIADEVTPLIGAGDAVSTDGPDLVLRPRATLALQMTIHELCTNAVKYGSLATENGRVRVSWKIDNDSDPRSLIMDWVESNGPPVASPEKRGFGSRVIETTVTYELEGACDLEFPRAGARCRISIPWNRRVGFVRGD